MTLTVFVGYDPREHEAWQVLDFSLRARAAEAGHDVSVVPVNHRDLRAQGIFDRTWWIGPDGQPYDDRDLRPFSTDFAHTRFAVPHLARRMGLGGHAVFVDVDFLFFSDPNMILDHVNDPGAAVYVVKHDFTGVDGMKMDGVRQEGYPRKLWSSLIVWNLDHESNIALDGFDLNHRPGRWWHTFSWLADDEIGELPPAWNWIPGHSSEDDLVPGLGRPHAVHFSFGGPWMAGYEDVPYAYDWHVERARMLRAEAERTERLGFTGHD